MPSSVNSVAAYSMEVLDGGVRLITAPLGQRNSASGGLMFKIGSRYEPARISGFSHFVEHMFFTGSRRFPTSKAVAAPIAGAGGGGEGWSAGHGGSGIGGLAAGAAGGVLAGGAAAGGHAGPPADQAHRAGAHRLWDSVRRLSPSRPVRTRPDELRPWRRHE